MNQLHTSLASQLEEATQLVTRLDEYLSVREQDYELMSKVVCEAEVEMMTIRQRLGELLKLQQQITTEYQPKLIYDEASRVWETVRRWTASDGRQCGSGQAGERMVFKKKLDGSYAALAREVGSDD